MKNGTKVQDINPSLIQKVYGKSDEEKFFDEKPKIEMIPTHNQVEQEEFEDDDDDNNYLFAETVEEEEPLRLEAKEIELIKNHLNEIKENEKQQLMNWEFPNEHCTENKAIRFVNPYNRINIL